MEENIKNIGNDSMNVKFDNVIERLRDRAISHRKIAKFYIIGLYSTILLAIGIYFIFNLWIQNDYEALNKELKDKLEINLTLLDSIIVESNGQLKKAENEYRDGIDSIYEYKVSNEELNIEFLNLNSELETKISEINTVKLQTILSNRLKEIQDTINMNKQTFGLSNYSLNSEAYKIENIFHETFNSARNQLSIINSLLSELTREENSRKNNKNYVTNDYYSLNQYSDTLDNRSRKINSLAYKVFKSKSRKEILNAVKKLKYSFDSIQKTNQSIENKLNDDDNYVSIKKIFDKINNDATLLNKNVNNYFDGINDSKTEIAHLKNLVNEIRTNLIAIDDQIAIHNQLLGRENENLNYNKNGLVNGFRDLINSYIQKENESRQSFKSLGHVLKKSGEYEGSIYSVPKIIARYGITIFLIYVIQIILSYNKYHYRLASFYDSKADILILKENINDIKTEDLFKLFDASNLSFGKNEFITKKAMELMKDMKDIYNK